MTTVTVRIGGMGCDHCVQAVRRGLESLPGVTVHEVSVGEARISFDERTADRHAINGAIRRAGYTPEPG